AWVPPILRLRDQESETVNLRDMFPDSPPTPEPGQLGQAAFIPFNPERPITKKLAREAMEAQEPEDCTVLLSGGGACIHGINSHLVTGNKDAPIAAGRGRYDSLAY